LRCPIDGLVALTVPIFHLDLEANDADRQVLAVMIWPNDPELRENYLVTTASLSKQKVKELTPLFREQAFRTAMQNIEVKLHRRLSDREIEALAARVARQSAWKIFGILAEIDEQYLEPHGGDGRLARVPGIDSIVVQAMTDGVRKGSACGEILWNIVTLDKHHPHLKASFNRAERIMVRRAKHEGSPLPGETYRRTKMWREYGPVAPLWAAYNFCKGEAREREIPWSSNQWLKSIVSVSLWFADFAVKFKAEQAKKYLLTVDQVVRLNPELSPSEPCLPPFTNQQLVWAA
jgi:hypothetical protein